MRQESKYFWVGFVFFIFIFKDWKVLSEMKLLIE